MAIVWEKGYGPAISQAFKGMYDSMDRMDALDEDAAADAHRQKVRLRQDQNHAYALRMREQAASDRTRALANQEKRQARGDTKYSAWEHWNAARLEQEARENTARAKQEATIADQLKLDDTGKQLVRTGLGFYDDNERYMPQGQDDNLRNIMLARNKLAAGGQLGAQDTAGVIGATPYDVDTGPDAGVEIRGGLEQSLRPTGGGTAGMGMTNIADQFVAPDRAAQEAANVELAQRGMSTELQNYFNVQAKVDNARMRETASTEGQGAVSSAMRQGAVGQGPTMNDMVKINMYLKSKGVANPAGLSAGGDVRSLIGRVAGTTWDDYARWEVENQENIAEASVLLENQAGAASSNPASGSTFVVDAASGVGDPMSHLGHRAGGSERGEFAGAHAQGVADQSIADSMKTDPTPEDFGVASGRDLRPRDIIGRDAPPITDDTRLRARGLLEGVWTNAKRNQEGFKAADVYSGIVKGIADDTATKNAFASQFTVAEQNQAMDNIFDAAARIAARDGRPTTDVGVIAQNLIDRTSGGMYFKDEDEEDRVKDSLSRSDLREDIIPLSWQELMDVYKNEARPNEFSWSEAEKDTGELLRDIVNNPETRRNFNSVRTLVADENRSPQDVRDKIEEYAIHLSRGASTPVTVETVYEMFNMVPGSAPGSLDYPRSPARQAIATGMADIEAEQEAANIAQTDLEGRLVEQNAPAHYNTFERWLWSKGIRP
jgi:hypothetical protein